MTAYTQADEPLSDNMAAKSFSRGNSHRQSGAGLSTAASLGVPVPTGSFRRVEVTLQDEDGAPLSNAIWVQSAGIFPTAAPVDSNGVANMWLLEVQYTSFQVLADSGRAGVDYVWYEPIDANDPINPLDDTATLKFQTSRITGLSAGNGPMMGGPLG